jgi:hypothetical protein
MACPSHPARRHSLRPRRAADSPSSPGGVFRGVNLPQATPKEREGKGKRAAAGTSAKSTGGNEGATGDEAGRKASKEQGRGAGGGGASGPPLRGLLGGLPQVPGGNRTGTGRAGNRTRNPRTPRNTTPGEEGESAALRGRNECRRAGWEGQAIKGLGCGVTWFRYETN